MRNPLESEEAAFRFVLGTIVYLAPIVAAAWIATWLGVIAFVVMSALAVVLVRRGAKAAPPVVSTERAAVEDTHRILVVTDAPRIGPRLREAILRVSAGVTEDVLVICAVAASTASPGGVEAPWPDASGQLETALQELRAAGVNARGALAADDAIGAVEGALRRFDAGEIVISIASAHRPAPGGLSRVAADDLAAAVRSRFDGPVTVVRDDG